MKRILLAIFSFMLVSASFAQVYVKGYYKANGTYVQPYVRSSPDNNPTNNYSYPGNTNPYTGKVATGNPDTYVKNLYKQNSSSTHFYVNDVSTLPSGHYLKLYIKGDSYTAYDIFNSSDIYQGYIVVYSNRTARIYDTKRTLLKTIDYFSSDITPSTSNDNYNTPSYTPSSSNYSSNNAYYPQVNTPVDYEYIGSIIHLKDSKGNFSGYYLELTYKDNEVKKYTKYNHSDFPVGSIEVYSNGEKIYYDSMGRIIKHYIPK